MSTSLSAFQIVVLCTYALGMAGGQLLFKSASLRLPAGAPLMERVTSLATNGWFIAAIVLYFALSILWVWVLSFTPLSRAYLFVAIAFAVTPLLGAAIFSEPLSTRLLIGIAVICFGIILVADS